jgi:hypothetical protein
MSFVADRPDPPFAPVRRGTQLRGIGPTAAPKGEIVTIDELSGLDRPSEPGYRLRVDDKK